MGEVSRRTASIGTVVDLRDPDDPMAPLPTGRVTTAPDRIGDLWDHRVGGPRARVTRRDGGSIRDGDDATGERDVER
jgi:hypothetical protein